MGLLLAGSFLIRFSFLTRTVGVPNLEASYHVLLTVTAFNENPINQHWFLPTVSLSKETDKHIPWGATISNESGNYIYTSFASPGFFAPFVFFKILGLQPQLSSLVIFNFFLQAVACLLLYILVNRLLIICEVKPEVIKISVILAVALQIFTCEALQSYGEVYWCQELYQIFFISSLILLSIILERDFQNCAVQITLLTLISFIGAWTEWTGFVFNACLIIMLFYRGWWQKQCIKLAFLVTLASIVALLVYVFHLYLGVDFYSTLEALKLRFLARSISAKYGIDSLFLGYFKSYGIFLPIIFGFAIYAVITGKTKRTKENSVVRFILLLSALSLLENVFVLQHAVQFSFDRLKMIVPAAILVSLIYSNIGSRARLVFISLIAISFFQNYVSFEQLLSEHAKWEEIDISNKQLILRAKQQADFNCAVIASNIWVRGYSNLLLQHGIYENATPENFSKILEKTPHCAGIYLEGKVAFPDLPLYSNIKIYKKDMTPVELSLID